MEANDLPTRQEDDFFTILGNAFKLINKSWEALVLNLGTFILVYILPFIIIFSTVIFWLGATFTNSNNHISTLSIVLGIIVGVGIGILLILLSIATIITQLASVRGQKISFQEVINQSMPFFWRFVGLGILSILVVLAGLVLFIVPGLLAIFFLVFSSYLMIDKNLGVVDSMKASYELVKQNWKIVVALFLLQFIIQIPSIVPVFGAIITTVLGITYFCLPAILYLRMANPTKVKVQGKATA